MPNRTFKNQLIYEYKDSMKSIIATTRFNNKTWQENRDFLQRAGETGLLPRKVQCLYPCSIPIGTTVPIFSKMFILEMNNELNHIMGIGLIKHESPEYNKYQVYENTKYNEFSYKGGYRIDREELTEEERGVLRELETLCFKGRRHQKRLQGIKAFPYDILYDYRAEKEVDLVVVVAEMFKRRFLTQPDPLPPSV
jgi:hypothetical protein